MWHHGGAHVVMSFIESENGIHSIEDRKIHMDSNLQLTDIVQNACMDKLVIYRYTK